MRLLPRLWRILRSKNFKRFLILFPTLLAIGLVCFYVGVNAWGRGKLEETTERLQQLGIPTTREEALNSQSSARPNLLELPELLRLSDHDTRTDLILAHYGMEGRPTRNFCGYDDAKELPSVSIFFPPSRHSESAPQLAAELLEITRPTAEHLNPVIAALKNPNYSIRHLPEESAEPLYRLSETLNFLLFRASLKAIADDSNGAMADSTLVLDFLASWLQQPKESTSTYLSLGVVSGISCNLDHLLHSRALNQQQLATLEEKLRQIEAIAPTLQSIEQDYWYILEYLQKNHSSTTLPIDQMRWGF